MPAFTLNTNVSKDVIPSNFLKDMTKLLADILGKPESFVCVQVNADQLMSWGGTTEPCAYGLLVSCGKVGPDVNKSHTIAILAKINSLLKIPKDRMYISFTDLPTTSMGWNDMTIEDLIQSRAAAAK